MVDLDICTTAQWLIDRVSLLDTKETSDVPTADRVARLFHGTETGTASDSDSDSEDHASDALEEIDFADLARVRAEVDAITQGTAAATTVEAAHKDEEEIEEVDFADLATIRAKVDAVEPQATSGDDKIIQETFTGVYNRSKDTMQVSSTTVNVDDFQPPSARQTLPLPTPPMHDDLKPSIGISKQSNHGSSTQAQDTILVEEEPFTTLDESSLFKTPETNHALSHDSHPLFVIDTTPTLPVTGNSASDVILIDRTGHGETLGDQDEERIVYVAPHPRSTRTTESPVPEVPRVKLPKTSMLTGRPVDTDVGGLRSPVREDGNDQMVLDRDVRLGVEAEAAEEPCLSLASLTIGPLTSGSGSAEPTRPSRPNAALRARKKEVRLQRQRQRQNKRTRLGFGAYGAMMSEARLREEDVKEKRHPRWQTRRREEDVDWGTEDEDEDQIEAEDQGGEKAQGHKVDDEVDAVSDALGGMEIDPDLEIDSDAMRGFLKSMSAEGSRFVTMDDIEDEARIQREDEEGELDWSSDSALSEAEEDEEEEEVFNIEGKILIAESEGDEELSEDSDDDDLSPGSSFQASLRKVRERSRGQHPKTVQKISEDEEEEEEPLPFTRSAADEEYIAHIQVSRESIVLARLSHAGTVRTSLKRTVKSCPAATANRKKPSFATYTRAMWANGT